MILSSLRLKEKHNNKKIRVVFSSAFGYNEMEKIKSGQKMSKQTTDNYKRMTEEPVEKLVLLFSIPTIISMLVNNIYNMVDTAFVGTLGNSASGAVGIVFGFMTVLQAVGFMFGQGSGSILSRKLGQNDLKGASVVASTGFFLSFIVATVVSILCFIFLDPLVMVLGSTKTIAPYAKEYIFYILLTAPFNVSSFTLNNILRFEGKAFYGMIGMMAGAVLNILGDAVLMFGFDLGIKGAGISTAVSQVISFVILISMFVRGKSNIKLSIKKVNVSPLVVGDIAATGLPSLLRQALNSVTTILLNVRAAVYGDEAVAAMSIVSRLYFFVFAIALGIGQGFQPVSGFNYGAGKYKRLKKAYKTTAIFAESIVLVLSVIVFVYAPDIVVKFRNDEKVVEIAVRALRLQLVAGIFMPACMATEMLFQSTGKKVGAALLSLIRSGLLFIPTLILLAKIRGLAGIQEAQPVAFILSVIPTLIFAISYFKSLPKEDNV